MGFMVKGIQAMKSKTKTFGELRMVKGVRHPYAEAFHDSTRPGITDRNKKLGSLWMNLSLSLLLLLFTDKFFILLTYLGPKKEEFKSDAPGVLSLNFLIVLHCRNL